MAAGRARRRDRAPRRRSFRASSTSSCPAIAPRAACCTSSATARLRVHRRAPRAREPVPRAAGAARARTRALDARRRRGRRAAARPRPHDGLDQPPRAAASRRDDLRTSRCSRTGSRSRSTTRAWCSPSASSRRSSAGMEDAVTVRDGDGRILLGNDAAVAAARRVVAARSSSRTSLADLWERYALYAPDGRPMRRRRPVLDARARRTSGPAPMLMRRVDRGDGRAAVAADRRRRCSHGGDGRPTLVMNVTEDVTATTRAELGRRLLVEAGRLLSETDGRRRRAPGGRRARRARRSRTGAASTCPAPAGYVHLAAVAAHRRRRRSRSRAAARRATRCTSTTTASLPRVIRTGEPRARGWSTSRCSPPRAARRRAAARCSRGAGPRRAARRAAALGRRRARRAHARRLAGRTGASTTLDEELAEALARRDRRRAAQRAPAARPRRDRARALGRPAARPVAAAAGLRGRRASTGRRARTSRRAATSTRWSTRPRARSW